MEDRKVWLFIEGDSPPPQLEPRAVRGFFVPLVGLEIETVATRSRLISEMTADEASLAKLVARGLSNAAMARSLNLGERTISRRTDRLKARFGVGSKAELSAYLAKVGLG